MTAEELKAALNAALRLRLAGSGLVVHEITTQTLRSHSWVIRDVFTAILPLIEPLRQAAEFVVDMQAAYPLATKQDCDECRHCGPVVMCSEHSFIAALHRVTGVGSAGRERIAALEAELERVDAKRQRHGLDLADALDRLETLRAREAALVAALDEALDGLETDANPSDFSDAIRLGRARRLLRVCRDPHHLNQRVTRLRAIAHPERE